MVLLSEPAESTLWDRLQECHRRGLPGIPRAELLGHLRTAARALDELYQRYGVAHLGLNPRNLLLTDGRLQVADFGLALLLWLPAGRPVAALNARYSPPELFDNRVSRSADSYNLALIYQEMLTGCHAFRNPSWQRSTGARVRGQPDLSLLPAGDREVIVRALQADADKRFPSCGELIGALEGGTIEPADDQRTLPELLPDVLDASAAPWKPPDPGAALPFPEQIIGQLVQTAAGPLHIRDYQGLRCRLEPGKLLEHDCTAVLLPGVARLKLDGFRQQWGAERAGDGKNTFVFLVGVRRSLWQCCLGQQPGLQVAVRLIPPPSASEATVVTIRIQPHACDPDQGALLLEQLGPVLVKSVCTYLQANPQRRGHDRFPFAVPLRVCPVSGGGKLAEPVECRGKDISQGGIRLEMPFAPVTPHLYVNLPTGGSLALLTKVVRARSGDDGWYEVRGTFCTSSEAV